MFILLMIIAAWVALKEVFNFVQFSSRSTADHCVACYYIILNVIVHVTQAGIELQVAMTS
jgi:hypothetical protein